MVFDVDKFIKLHLLPNGRYPVKYKPKELVELIEEAKAAFGRDASLLELAGPISVAGSLHGHFLDLLALFTIGGFPSQTAWLFLGNYIDRGPRSLETLCLLLACKIKYPDHVFLLRGSHETTDMNAVYGFKRECYERATADLWQEFQSLFNWFPIAARIGGRVFCVASGLSPQLQHLSQLSGVRPPLDIPSGGLLFDLLFSRPNSAVRVWGTTATHSLAFGEDQVNQFCQQNDLDLIIRSGQVVREGFQFFPGQKLVTIFSAPHYCNEFDNKGAIMEIDNSLHCRFKALLPPSDLTLGTSETGMTCSTNFSADFYRPILHAPASQF